MNNGFPQLREALESIGFKPTRHRKQEKNGTVDDGDFDDTLEEHQADELARLRRV